MHGKRAGKTVYVGRCDGGREAEGFEQDWQVTQHEIEGGELPSELDTWRTFGHAIDSWLASSLKRKSRREGGHRKRLEVYSTSAVEGPHAVRDHVTQIEDFRDEIATRFAPSTFNGMITCLSSPFRVFNRRDWG